MRNFSRAARLAAFDREVERRSRVMALLDLSERNIAAEERPKYRARMIELRDNTDLLHTLTLEQLRALRAELVKLPRHA